MSVKQINAQYIYRTYTTYMHSTYTTYVRVTEIVVVMYL